MRSAFVWFSSGFRVDQFSVNFEMASLRPQMKFPIQFSFSLLGHYPLIVALGRQSVDRMHPKLYKMVAKEKWILTRESK